MAEVYDFLECEIYKLGTVAGGTTPYSIDAFAEGVSVSLGRELQDRADTSGVVQQRIPVKTGAEMSISKLYLHQGDLSFVDGNDIQLVMGNALGTEKFQMTKCYWQNKDWAASGDDLVAYGVSIVGNSFGTVA